VHELDRSWKFELAKGCHVSPILGCFFVQRPSELFIHDWACSFPTWYKLRYIFCSMGLIVIDYTGDKIQGG